VTEEYSESFRIHPQVFYGTTVIYEHPQVVLSAGSPGRRSHAPKGKESLAQGLRWVTQNRRFALKGLAKVQRLRIHLGWPLQG
jgi:hypothetical protein